jgi:chitodextrinase
MNGASPTAGADPGVYSGHALGTLSWSFDGALSPTGNNSFDLSIPSSQSVSDYQILDKITVTYERRTVAEQGALLITDDDADRRYEVSGLSSAPYLFLLGDPDPLTGLCFPSALTGASFASGTLTFELPAAGTTSRTLALASTTLLPGSVAACASRDLSDPSLGCDLLVVTHPDLHPQGQDGAWRAFLARRSAAMAVTVVDIQEVYDNYSYGIFDPTAIRTFLQDAAAQWAKVPRYVLLAGDATYDYKNYLGSPGFKNLVPTMMVEDTSDYVYMGFYATDAWYADVNGDGFPDMAVGRIPAASYADLAGVLQKLAVYEGQDASGDWAKSAFYVADTYRQPWEQQFELFNNQLQETMTIAPWLNAHVYFHDPPYNGTDYNAAAAAVRPWFGQCGLVHYDGHSGMTFWGYHDGILSANPVRGTSSDVDLLPAFDPLGPSMPLPFVVNSSCYNSGVQWSYRSIMEDLLLRPDLGSIGSYGYSGLAYTNEEETVTRSLFADAFGWDKERTLGDLEEAGRFALPSSNGRAVFSGILLGDPSLRLKLPAPLPPARLDAVPADAAVFLSWPSPPSPVDHFVLYRSSDGGQTWGTVTAPASGDLAYVDTEVQNGTTYTYVLKSWDPDGFEGAPTEEATATPDAGLCAILCQATVPSVIPVGETAEFHGEAQTTSCLGPPDFAWDFGDGTGAATADAVHAYGAPGSYPWSLTASRESASCTKSGTLRVVVPPTVVSVKKLQNPFRIKIEGTGFQADATAIVDGSPGTAVTVKSDQKLVLKGGSSLKALFPPSTFVSIRIVNGDGGEVSVLYDRTCDCWQPGG